MGGKSAHKATIPSPEDSASSRSFFSRLSLLSRPRTRAVADFHIRPAEPHRKYSAGDHVQGAVILTVIKPIRITHLTVTLHGFVKVHKGPAAAQDPQPVNPSQSPSGGAGRIQYFGNGHASLFQDEQVLSADGKLETGRYEFGFDLIFPSKGLPSSIDFERGTIAYMITATLTRPTAIAPTTSCERKIYLVEKVDIGSLPLPRPRTISLEPISRRSKRKRPPVVDRRSTNSDVHDSSEPSVPESHRAPESVTDGSVATTDDASQQISYLQLSPRSPTRTEFIDVVSDFSGESSVGGSTANGAVSANRISDAAVSSSSASQGGSRTPTAEDKTITASVEMLKGGCLPGDFVPVKISVHHIKRIKSMHGVIATLYRQGRIDSSPPIHLFKDVLSKEEMRRLEKEEYFPRSKTGLSGLSLSSAGSCSVFRKDLSQAFGPLIIDPVTLDASVTISVRLPEDVFPTIKGVPGELISFKYQLEVIVDLGGKLASQIQSGQSKTGPMSGPPGTSPQLRNPYENSSSMFGPWGGTIIDTDQLRRQKGVIAVVFEVPVGTLDSSRQRSKGLQRGLTVNDGPPDRQQPSPAPPLATHFEDEKQSHRTDFVDEGYAHAEDDGQYPPFIYEYPPDHHFPPHELPPVHAPVYAPPPPPPQMDDESGLSEKERLRRAEQRLLPSQPAPDPSAAASSSRAFQEREVDEEDLYNDSTHDQPSPPQDQRQPPFVPVASQLPTAPALEDLEGAASSSSAPHAPAEDKLERERRRLLTEASAPSGFPDDYQESGSSEPGPGAAAGPSAPSAPPAADSTAWAIPSAPPPPEDDFDPPYAHAPPRGQRDGGHYTHPGLVNNSVGISSLSSQANRPVDHTEPLPRYVR